MVNLDTERCLKSDCQWFIRQGGYRDEYRRVKFEFTEERMIHIAKVLAEYVKENQEEA